MKPIEINGCVLEESQFRELFDWFQNKHSKHLFSMLITMKNAAHTSACRELTDNTIKDMIKCREDLAREKAFADMLKIPDIILEIAKERKIVDR